jgi:hypothetical protein
MNVTKSRSVGGNMRDTIELTKDVDKSGGKVGGKSVMAARSINWEIQNS